MLTGDPLVPEDRLGDDVTYLGWLIAMSGHTFPKTMVMQSPVKDSFFDSEGMQHTLSPQYTSLLKCLICSRALHAFHPERFIPGTIAGVGRCMCGRCSRYRQVLAGVFKPLPAQAFFS